MPIVFICDVGVHMCITAVGLFATKGYPACRVLFATKEYPAWRVLFASNGYPAWRVLFATQGYPAWRVLRKVAMPPQNHVLHALQIYFISCHQCTECFRNCANNPVLTLVSLHVYLVVEPRLWKCATNPVITLVFLACVFSSRATLLEVCPQPCLHISFACLFC